MRPAISSNASASHTRLRVAIDARPFAGPPCGYTIYLASIIQCLRADFDLVLLTNQPLRAAYEEIAGIETQVFGAHGDLRWEQTDLVRYLEGANLDVFFAGANRGIPLRKTKSTRYVLGLLDIIPYLFFRQYFLGKFLRWAATPHFLKETASQLVSIARADAILTISQQSAKDIRRVFRRHQVTAFPIRLRDVRVMEGAATKPQFVYVGGVDYRKRVDVLLRGFARFSAEHPGYRLFLIGANYAALHSLIAELGLEDRVVLTGYISHEEKFRILAESFAMVYPSLYEGYGLAIAEAFQAGIPVIAGIGGSQAEVGGDAMRRIDPTEPDDIAAAMGEMLNPAVRARWSARGKTQLERLADPAIEQKVAAFFCEQGELARARLA